MIFTKSIDVYVCEDVDDTTAEDKLCGIISKHDDDYWRWHTARRLVLTCNQMKLIAMKVSDLNKGLDEEPVVPEVADGEPTLVQVNENLRAYIKLWDGVDQYVRKHSSIGLGQSVPDSALRLLKEGDQAKQSIECAAAANKAEHE